MTADAKPNRQCGFTLIEVVIAFAIFALCMGALYEIFAGAAHRSAQARDQEITWLLAQSVLAEVRGGATPQEVRQSGKFRSFAWRVEIVPHKAGMVTGGHWQLHEVTVHLERQSAGRPALELRSIEWFRSEP